ncbi:hypothetical protein QAD02_008624 [Eretmocerus hayati]|uniref:Uncharacterized protein n=1 Tax=Eretmocerus hayati TaxID=131215 RepID=A0ACC2N732_9HYME|nr:hypothetical protein QAD02_008624 [Eretmocerus hayati]
MATVFSIMLVQAMGGDGDTAVDRVFQQIKYNLSPYKIVVIAETLNNLSPLSRKIIQRADEDCGAMISDYDGIGQMNDYHEVDLKSPTYEFSILGPSALVISIVETRHKFDLSSKMRTVLEKFDEQKSFGTSKFLINLITDQTFDSDNILRASWSEYRFVDTTIIQWIPNDHIQGTTINVTHELSHQVFVYSYNPFNNTFRAETLTDGTELFPEKLKDLHEFPFITTLYFEPPLHATVRHLSEKQYHKSWIVFTEMLMEVINCTLRIQTESEFLAFKPQASDDEHVPNLRYRQDNTESPDENQGYEWILSFVENMYTIHIPSPILLHLHVLQTKSYKDDISFAAIVAFAGLFFTAFIFAVWARFLGLEDQNWSFLNILTAQMGGSVAHGRPLKLSEMIFQMSIYIATFIVVTLGTDYMLQIFILRYEPREIRTIQELADSDIDFFVDFDDLWDFHALAKEFTIETIKSRMNLRIPDPGFYAFCKLPSKDLSTMVDTKINLCISHSENKEFILPSNSEFQISKIEDPIFIRMPSIIIFIGAHPFFKKRFDMIVQRFSDVGLIDMWKNQRSRMYDASGDRQPMQLKEDQNEVRPLQDQLWPILVVGSTVSILALIIELIWKRFIEKTEFGKLCSAFYSDLR